MREDSTPSSRLWVIDFLPALSRPIKTELKSIHRAVAKAPHQPPPTNPKVTHGRTFAPGTRSENEAAAVLMNDVMESKSSGWLGGSGVERGGVGSRSCL